MSTWNTLFVPDIITQSLVTHGIAEPTPIQQHVIPCAIRDRCDILGSAPTLSAEESNNNTQSRPSKRPRKQSRRDVDSLFNQLASIEQLDAATGQVVQVHDLIDNSQLDNSIDHQLDDDTTHIPPFGLVLVPTRELAMQVCQHLKMITEKLPPPSIRIQPIVGGMSIQKQNRLIATSRPDIVVATPGRLIHLIDQVETAGNNDLVDNDPSPDHDIATLVANTCMVVVDEADRFVEAKHLDDLGRLVGKRSDDVKRQVLVFSATLTFVHLGAVQLGKKRKHLGQSTTSKNRLTSDGKVDLFRHLLDMSKRTKLFDLSSSSKQPDVALSSNDSNHTQRPTTAIERPSGLTEFQLTCPNQAAKDVYLFWLLALGRFQLPTATNNNGRCLVFVNSKAGLRRLNGVMRQLTTSSALTAFNQPGAKLLHHSIPLLHADMGQKQRLRALERFQSDPNGLLLASDLASRGLDLATHQSQSTANSDGVGLVIHFDVPHTAELYIHRSGRTARATRLGVSVMLTTPNETPRWRRLAASLLQGHESFTLPELPSKPTGRQLSACQSIVRLAKQLDLAQHTQARHHANESWLNRAAEEADILLDGDDDSTNHRQGSKAKRNSMDKESERFLAIQRQDLIQLIRQCQQQTSRDQLAVIKGSDNSIDQQPIPTSLLPPPSTQTKEETSSKGVVGNKKKKTNRRMHRINKRRPVVK